MLSVAVTNECEEKLRQLLSEEDEGACVRIREAKVGCACKSRFELRLSIDEREEDDIELDVAALPLVTTQEIIDHYGETFHILLNDEQLPIVAVPQR